MKNNLIFLRYKIKQNSGYFYSNIVLVEAKYYSDYGIFFFHIIVVFYLFRNLENNSTQYVQCVVIRSFLHSQLIIGYITRATRQVPLVEQKLLPVRCTWIYLGFQCGLCCSILRCQYSVLQISICLFYFDHCIVCTFTIYCFWLRLLVYLPFFYLIFKL